MRIPLILLALLAVAPLRATLDDVHCRIYAAIAPHGLLPHAPGNFAREFSPEEYKASVERLVRAMVGQITSGGRNGHDPQFDPYGFERGFWNSIITGDFALYLEALYSRQVNQRLADTVPPPAVNGQPVPRMLLVVHQQAAKQAETAQYAERNLAGVPMVVLASQHFAIQDPKYLQRSSAQGGGVVFSQSGKFRFDTRAGEPVYRALEINTPHLDMAGGFASICFKQAIGDAIESAYGNGQKTFTVNVIPHLTYMNEGQTITAEIKGESPRNQELRLMMLAIRWLPPGRFNANQVVVNRPAGKHPFFTFRNAAGETLNITFND